FFAVFKQIKFCFPCESESGSKALDLRRMLAHSSASKPSPGAENAPQKSVKQKPYVRILLECSSAD
ncbi:MAG: hypothetical protein ACI4UV_09050, partial [Victivallales bacterium]